MSGPAGCPGPSDVPAGRHGSGQNGPVEIPGEARQVIAVTAAERSSTRATLRAYRRSGHSFEPALPPMPARIGRNGFSDRPREGGGNTPIGVYPIGGTMYGVLPAPPGLRYPYHRLVPGDWWDCEPSSPAYNSFVRAVSSPGGDSEALWTVVPGYHHFAVVGYNLPVAVPGAGSAFFLHEDQGGPTAGCVSLAHDDLVTLLTWLDPAESPHVAMGPKGDAL
jgi:L,D-peptidoglycan transpeptidase YkuD (ErfK/YbiS/YcfS/YnhG family)